MLIRLFIHNDLIGCGGDINQSESFRYAEGYAEGECGGVHQGGTWRGYMEGICRGVHGGVCGGCTWRVLIG